MRITAGITLLVLVLGFITSIKAAPGYEYEAIGQDIAISGNSDFVAVASIADGCDFTDEISQIGMVGGTLYGWGPQCSFCINDQTNSGFVTYRCNNGEWKTRHFTDVAIIAFDDA